MPDFLLSTDPIPVAETPPFAPGEGAEVRFLGTVRGMEDGVKDCRPGAAEMFKDG